MVRLIVITRYTRQDFQQVNIVPYDAELPIDIEEPRFRSKLSAIATLRGWKSDAGYFTSNPDLACVINGNPATVELRIIDEHLLSEYIESKVSESDFQPHCFSLKIPSDSSFE